MFRYIYIHTYTIQLSKNILPVSQQRERDVTAQNGYGEISFLDIYLHGTIIFIALNLYLVIC
jgi:hypothetical protein